MDITPRNFWERRWLPFLFCSIFHKKYHHHHSGLGGGEATFCYRCGRAFDCYYGREIKGLNITNTDDGRWDFNKYVKDAGGKGVGIKTYKVGFRGLWYLFQRRWYSLYRWKNVQEFEGYKIRVIDAGAFYLSESERIT